VNLRWFAYFGIWRPALWLAFVVAEVLANLGVDRIGRRLLIDTLMDIEERI